VRTCCERDAHGVTKLSRQFLECKKFLSKFLVVEMATQLSLTEFEYSSRRAYGHAANLVKRRPSRGTRQAHAHHAHMTWASPVTRRSDGRVLV
jgi:hypothetical protein